MVLSIQTTTFSAYGGIPTYNRLMCRALNEMSEETNSRVLIAMDKPDDAAKASEVLPNLTVEAFDGNRISLSLRFIRLALRREGGVLLIGHVHYAALGLILKRLRPSLKYGVFLYGIDAWQQLKGLRRYALQQADFMISISEYTKQSAIAVNGLDAKKIYLLPNAADWPDDTLGVQQIAQARPLRLLTVCRLDQGEQYKGVDKVIEALPEVSKRVPQLQYTVIGGGTDLIRHKQLAEDLGVAANVIFPGFVSDDALQKHYSECDIFVMPSAAEGFGFVFLEAMRYGKPIIAAKSGGTPEVVADGITGQLVEYGRQEQLVEALITLCLDKDKRERMGAAGHQRLQDNFTFSHFKQKLSEILNQERPLRAATKVTGRPSTDTPQVQ